MCIVSYLVIASATNDTKKQAHSDAFVDLTGPQHSVDVSALVKHKATNETEKGEIADDSTNANKCHSSNPAAVVVARAHFSNGISSDRAQRYGAIGDTKGVRPNAKTEKCNGYASDRDKAEPHVFGFRTANVTTFVTGRLTIN